MLVLDGRLLHDTRLPSEHDLVANCTTVTWIYEVLREKSIRTMYGAALPRVWCRNRSGPDHLDDEYASKISQSCFGRCCSAATE